MAKSEGDPRRIEIVYAVWQVIARDGMSAVSMRSVATAAEVSVGRIQYWFNSKEELLLRSLEAMLAGAEEQHEAITNGVDDRDTLWQLISHSIPAASKSPVGASVFYHYVAAAMAHPALATKIAEAKRGTEAEGARLLRSLRPESPRAEADSRALIALGDGLAVRVLIGDLSESEAEEALRIELARVLAVCSPRENRGDEDRRVDQEMGQHAGVQVAPPQVEGVDR